MRFAGLILAAGGASRFGAPKAIARLDGRPLLEHVVAAAGEAGLDPIVVVLGTAGDAIEASVEWGAALRVTNPDPDRGLASSLRVGIEAVADLEPRVDAAVVLLGDQPLVRAGVVRRLVDAYRGDDRDRARSLVVPSYRHTAGTNPVVVGRDAFDIARTATGDRGLGPIIGAHPELVVEVEVPGDNPDVDTPADLVRLVEAAWADRVRRNREQVERLREVADGADFYSPVSRLFRADPRRTDDPVLDRLRALVRADDLVLDIGAGAGRYALPIALVAGEVIAVDPSRSMLEGLEAGIAEHGIGNIRVIEGRWPPDGTGTGDQSLAAKLPAPPFADVSLLAHVGYDVEAIGPFLDAMEGATRRRCVAVAMERSPATLAEPFWPRVHGEPRVRLPALPELVELLEARRRDPRVEIVDAERRRWRDRDELLASLRQQLWTAPGSEKDARLLAALDDLAEVDGDGSIAIGELDPLRIGVVTWCPPPVP